MAHGVSPASPTISYKNKVYIFLYRIVGDTGDTDNVDVLYGDIMVKFR